MVIEMKKGGNVFYICEECCLPYIDRESAQDCEDNCKYHT